MKNFSSWKQGIQWNLEAVCKFMKGPRARKLPERIKEGKEWNGA